MLWRWRHTPHTVHVDDWITREFTQRGLAPPHCTPEALARALERERQITIAFRAHVSGDPGVYGLLYRSQEDKNTHIVLFRPSRSIVLLRLTLFHELAHLIFDYRFPDVRNQGTLHCALISDAKEAQAEAFAIGAMHYSFIHTSSVLRTNREEDVVSAFGSYLQRTAYWP